jgi:DNA-binding PadR family transcriptional regulator
MHDERMKRKWAARHFHHHEGGGPFRARRGMWEDVAYGRAPWAGKRARRGDVRTAVLAVLAEKPLHGYDVIRDLEERSGGAWSPSPGSIYPTLQMLEDEGLVVGEEHDGKRVYSLTDAGRKELDERRERSGGAEPWDVGGVPERFLKLREAGFQLVGAAMQAARAGDAAQVDKVTEILSEARRKIYEVLAKS